MPATSSEDPQGKQKKPKKSKLASIVSGAVSGVFVSAVVQPLDVVRTRMQADVAKGVFLSTARTFRTVVAEGGVKALWKGTQATVLRLGVGAGLHFFFLESLKPMLERTQPDGRKKITVTGAAVAGGVARGLAAFVACPITVVKTQMEYTGPGAVQYRGTVDAMSSIMRQRGVRGLFSGVGPTLLSNAPFSAIYYVFYTQMQDRLSSRRWPTFATNFASGTVAAVAATLITQPADVVRTHMQLGLSAAAAGGGCTAAAVAGGGLLTRRAPALFILGRIVREQGARGLMAGAVPRIVKRTFQTALVWALYEEMLPRLSTAAHWAGDKLREAQQPQQQAQRPGQQQQRGAGGTAGGGESSSSSGSDTEGEVQSAARW